MISVNTRSIPTTSRSRFDRATLRSLQRLHRPVRREPPRFSWHTIRLFHIASVPVELHTSCLAYPAGFLLVLALAGDLGRALHMSRWQGALIIEGFLCFVWACLLVHEFAHVFAARRCGIGTQRVVLLPIGAVALMKQPPADKRELWIALAGPAASLALAGLCWLVAQSLPHSRTLVGQLPRLMEFGCAINLSLALFNMLPCFPMDGGRTLRSLLAAAIEFFGGVRETRAFELATRVVVRFVNPLLVLGGVAALLVALTLGGAGCGPRNLVLDQDDQPPTFEVHRGPPCRMALIAEGEVQASVEHRTARCRLVVDDVEVP